MRSLIVVVVAASGWSSLNAQTINFDANTLVKRADSGICHPPGTIYYERVQQFEAMSLSQCLMGGGRVPRQYEAYWAVKQVADNQRCDTNPQQDVCRQEVEQSERAGENQRDQEMFSDFKFGVAVAAAQFHVPKIENVEIVDASVVVRAQREIVTSVLFESHKFFTFPRTGPDFGLGPFVAASLANSEKVSPLSMFAFGAMVGWRRQESSGSWNVGFGWVVDTDAVELRDGVSDGAPTMITNASDLVRTVNQEGLLLLFSATW